MKYIDPKLGVPLPERDYGGNCLMYDPGNTTDPFHNIWVRQLECEKNILQFMANNRLQLPRTEPSSDWILLFMLML